MDSKKFFDKICLSEKLVERCIGLEDLSDNESFYFYTGKGTRNDVLHLGHFYLFSILQKLSEKYPLVFQLSGDEKRGCLESFQSLEQALKISDDTKHILQTFNWKNLYFFDNLNPATQLQIYNCANFIGSKIKVKTALNTFGNTSIFTAFYIAVQLAPIFLMKSKLPNHRCVIITAQDQKGFFFILRDLAKKLNIEKPVIIILKSLKDIKMKDKMSSSRLKESIPFNNLGIRKIKKAISAPIINDELDTQNDFVAMILEYFINSSIDASELLRIRQNYIKLKSTGETKELLISYFQNILKERRSRINLKDYSMYNKINSFKDVIPQMQIYEKSYI
jgi:tryptophanyl-tRNA synthetase